MKFFLLIFTVFSLHIFSQVTSSEIEDLLKNNAEYSDLINESKVADSSIDGGDKSIDHLLVETEEKDEKSNIFGFDFIKSTPKSISSTSDLPVPNDYVLSLGDKLNFIFTGGKKDSFTLTVGMDGAILLPELGSISVFGESFSSVRKKIQDLVELSYVGTNVSISLDELAAKKINIVGAVKNPGTYIINPFSTISSALAYSGGFNDYASIREIILIRGDKKIIFDLYDLLIFGDRDGDINVQQADTILVNSTNNFVEIAGEVKDHLFMSLSLMKLLKIWFPLQWA